MKINHDKRPADVLATLGAEKLAQIIVDMALAAGTDTDWSSETIEYVLNPLQEPFRKLGIAWIGDTGSNKEHLKYWRVEEQLQRDPSFELIETFIDLGIRTNEQGYVDSIRLVHDGILAVKPGQRDDELAARLKSDLIEIEDSGYDLDTMTDLLTEWEETGEEYGLSCYADGEAGVYRVTNLPDEED